MPVQEHPPEHCYVLMQDHGPDDGGWGTAALPMSLYPVGGPMVYTGSDDDTILALHSIANVIATATGKPTQLAKFTHREVVLMIPGRDAE